jgi:hypothetical protein
MSLFRFVNPVHSSSDEFLIVIIEGLKLIATFKELLIISLGWLRNWFRITIIGRLNQILSCLELNTLESLLLFNLMLLKQV